MLPLPPFFLLYTLALLYRQKRDKHFQLSWWHKVIWALYLRISLFAWLCEMWVLIFFLGVYAHECWARRGTPVQSQEH